MILLDENGTVCETEQFNKTNGKWEYMILIFAWWNFKLFSKATLTLFLTLKDRTK